MEINIPSLKDQKMVIYENQLKESYQLLLDNLNAPYYPKVNNFDSSKYGIEHLKLYKDGWKPPHPDLVNAWFTQFKQTFPEYKTDEKIAILLGLTGSESNRRIRAFRHGEQPIPYGLWRNFLVRTGRVNQEIIPVMGFFED
ncbi:hypothetical protein [Yersinia aldovae]|uniref:hypothetical protein n=1 Tax=Yersinia aldovae TaxID=29483 RepID=UPI0005AC29E1|nr:hypothetical protein [Yersinia aldovae]AJJ63094.1 hypothetical protein AT01_1263 [Yersinia aldovae 670-83]